MIVAFLFLDFERTVSIFMCVSFCLVLRVGWSSDIV